MSDSTLGGIETTQLSGVVTLGNRLYSHLPMGTKPLAGKNTHAKLSLSFPSRRRAFYFFFAVSIICPSASFKLSWLSCACVTKSTSHGHCFARLFRHRSSQASVSTAPCTGTIRYRPSSKAAMPEYGVTNVSIRDLWAQGTRRAGIEDISLYVSNVSFTVKTNR